jgi:hypothetical protein
MKDSKFSQQDGISKKKLTLRKETLQRLKSPKTGIRAGRPCVTAGGCTEETAFCTSQDSMMSLCEACGPTSAPP